jgi:hypothetical protein
VTQSVFGLSRDDSASFIGTHQKFGIFEREPFVTLDAEGPGELVRLAAKRGRAARPGLKLEICGEHGGDPASIRIDRPDRAIRLEEQAIGGILGTCSTGSRPRLSSGSLDKDAWGFERQLNTAVAQLDAATGITSPVPGEGASSLAVAGR